MNRPFFPSLHDAEDIPQENDHLDDIDRMILRQLLRAWALRHGPRVGDFVTSGEDLLRIGYVWDQESFLPTAPAAHGSFHMTDTAMVSYSGALGLPIQTDELRASGEIRPGQFWFFHHGYPGASNDVHVWAPCRVYSIQED